MRPAQMMTKILNLDLKPDFAEPRRGALTAGLAATKGNDKWVLMIKNANKSGRKI
jgi:hypothetical protein